MYQRARKLAGLGNTTSEQFLGLAELQLEAYLVSINALSLVDPKSAWIILPFIADPGNEVSACSILSFELCLMALQTGSRKRRKLSKHIPESKYAIGKRDAEVVELPDIQYEYALLSAQVELVKRSPALLAVGGR